MKRTTNKRKLIRHKISELLKAELVNFVKPSNIELNSSEPNWDNDESLPAVRVYNISEGIETWNDAPRELRRDAYIVVDIMARTTKKFTASDHLDDIDQQIRNILLEDETLEGVSEDIIPTDVNFVFDNDSKSEIGSLQTTYMVSYLDVPVEDVTDQKSRGVAELKDIDTLWDTNKKNVDPDGNPIYEMEQKTEFPDDN
jgi:hypothetical protein